MTNLRPLETLVAEAADIDAGSSVAQRSDWPSPAVTEAARLMGICNACRYCEGFCAVFPAMTRRLHFGSADIHYLANLCHSCGACLPACQYASPHEFAVNVPKVMAQVRGQTYFDHAWPAAFAALYRRNGLALTLAVSLASFLFLVLAIQWRGNLFTQQLAGRFYDIYPHRVLALLFGSVFGFVALSLGISVRRFWRAVSPGRPSQSAVLESLGNVLRLQYLDGGHGEGCNDEDDRFTLRRRRFHHFTFYGFVLCFAATTVATGYHYLRGLEAPYDYLSVPVLLGSIGGMSLLIGLSGQLFLNARRAVEQRDPSQQAMDIGFMTVLYVTAVTGFAVLIGRNTQAMGLLLALHLGTVMGLFLTLPYGKFAHGIYRSAALLKWAIEKRRPNTLRFGD